MILSIGPFVGSFEQEIISFRPYALWIMDRMEHDKAYISTHFNRTFLYDFIPSDNILPVYRYLSRNEEEQENYTHSLMDLSDYNDLFKRFKDTISKKENCLKKEIQSYSVNYTRIINQVPIYNKKFQRIEVNNINTPKEYLNRYVIIPSEKSKDMSRIFDCLKNYIVIGDMKTFKPTENVILKFVDYFENGWKYIIDIINHAKAVICPVSFWTLLCNMQGVPVFSWGESIGQYKPDGIYHLGNEKSMVIPNNDNNICDMLNYFISNIR